MNIFVLSYDPREAAQSLHDTHLVKMILETCQLLCTAKRYLDGTFQTITKTDPVSGKTRKKTYYVLPDAAEDDLLYEAGWLNHPCSIWLRQSDKNWRWLHTYLVELTVEYSRRYGGKTHASVASGLVHALVLEPKNIPITNTITPFAQAMPEIYKREDAVDAYRAYYVGAKAFNRSGRFMAKYRAPALAPAWWSDYNQKYGQFV